MDIYVDLCNVDASWLAVLRQFPIFGFSDNCSGTQTVLLITLVVYFFDNLSLFSNLLLEFCDHEFNVIWIIYVMDIKLGI